MWDYYISRETKFLKRATTICYGHSSFIFIKYSHYRQFLFQVISPSVHFHRIPLGTFSILLFTHSFENLSCQSYNVVNVVRSLWVDICRGNQRKVEKKNKRTAILNYTGGNQLLYKHFNLPDHSVLSMKVRILEKIYQSKNIPGLSTPFRRKREEHWIR